MNLPLPDRMTGRPERAGLTYHEIIADGLFHAAAVAGLERDDTLVERVAFMAWVNGAMLVAKQVPSAARISSQLSQSLEAGPTEIKKLCLSAQAAIGTAANPAPGLLELHRQAQVSDLSANDPATIRLVRQLVGTAALAGIHSRALQPGLFKSLYDFGEDTHGDHRFLTTRLWDWALHDDLPYAYPFIEYLNPMYSENEREGKLIRDGCRDALLAALQLNDPWRMGYWLDQGWARGTLMVRFAPDLLVAAAGGFSATEASNNHKIMEEFLEDRAGIPESEGLAHGFQQFLDKWNPYGLADTRFRAGNPLLLAARAYDYAFWMGAGTLRPELFAHTEEA
jgi:hypothetical protein